MGAPEANVPVENSDNKDLGAKIDNAESASSSSQQELGFDAGATSRLIRKIDWTLLPFLALLYLLSFLDRTVSYSCFFEIPPGPLKCTLTDVRRTLEMLGSQALRRILE